MERIAAAGVSLRDTDVAGLELVKRAVVSDEDRLTREIADALGASEVVVLSTCNRLDVYFAREEGHLPRCEDRSAILERLGIEGDSPERERFFFASGVECARHLLRVACSLDSLVLGEGEILSQVREAFERAQERGWTGRLLTPLFQVALQTGKEARARTDIAQHPISLVSLGLAAIAGRFGTSRPRVAVIGAGRIGRRAALGGEQAGLSIALVVNRSLPAAERIAAEIGARAMCLDEFRAGTEPVDALVSATSAPGTVLDAAALRALAARTPLGRRLTAVDLAIPRDLEPLFDERVEIIDLEALREAAERNRALRERAVCQVEALIERRLETFARRGSGRRAAGLLEELRGETRDILEREIAGLSAGRLAELSDEERRAVERWARSAFGRIEHAPLTLIRRLCEKQDAPAGGEA